MKEFADVDALIRQIEKDMDKSLETFSGNVRDVLMGEIKERTPVRTGDLKKGFEVRDEEQGFLEKGFAVVNEVEYAPVVEYGRSDNKMKGAFMADKGIKATKNRLKKNSGELWR